MTEADLDRLAKLAADFSAMMFDHFTTNSVDRWSQNDLDAILAGFVMYVNTHYLTGHEITAQDLADLRHRIKGPIEF